MKNIPQSHRFTENKSEEYITKTESDKRVDAEITRVVNLFFDPKIWYTRCDPRSCKFLEPQKVGLSQNLSKGAALQY